MSGFARDSIDAGPALEVLKALFGDLFETDADRRSQPIGPGAAAPGATSGLPRACVAVSGCLLGSPCRFDGRAKPDDAVARLVCALKSRGVRIQRICPESAARLSRPRPPAELRFDGRVVDRAGNDLTEAFLRGADRTADLAARCGVRVAVLKSKSPSCACHEVYDGTFSSRLVEGRGVGAAALVDRGIPVADERDAAALALAADCAAASLPKHDKDLACRSHPVGMLVSPSDSAGRTCAAGHIGTTAAKGVLFDDLLS